MIDKEMMERAYHEVDKKSECTKKTNRDFICSMSNEDLAEWIANNGAGCVGKDKNYPHCGEACEKCWLKWLREEKR